MGRALNHKFLFFIIIVILIYIFFCMTFQNIGKKVGFGINKTNSQKPGIYLYFSNKQSIKKGELVDFDLDLTAPDLKWIKYRNYINKEKLLKNIGAMPGDWLFTVYPKIYSCNKNKLTKECKILGFCLKRDSKNFSMFCKQWNGVKIPKNYFYLTSNRVSNSFDSRYFGLVHIKNIHHKLILLLDLS